MSATLSTSLATGITLTPDGVYLSPFTLTATGTIQTAAGNAVQSSVYNAGLINDGTLMATGAGTTANGVSFSNGGTVLNSSTASLIEANNDGVYITGGLGTVFNAGTIIGGNLGGSATGVWLENGGTVINSGTISGTQDAVLFTGTYANLLVVDAGAVFAGTVQASASASNTLELAAGAGTLNGFGTQFEGFNTLAFDLGAAWTVSGSNFNDVQITGLESQDALDITDFSATGTATVSATGLLELTNSTGGTLDLTLAANQAGEIFDLQTDGAGGIDLTNESTDFLAVSVSNGITLTAYGADVSAFTVTATGAVATTYGAAVQSALYNATLVNAGSLNGAAYGVLFTDGGNVTNSGTASSIVSTDGNAVQITNASGTVFNQGTLTAEAGMGVFLGDGGTVTNSGAASDINGGVWINGTLGTVLNAGTITGGVGLGGGYVFNSGSITADWFGMAATGAPTTLVNDGSIYGGRVAVYLQAGGYVLNNAGAGISGGRGVIINGAVGTVENDGTITGLTASYFGAGVLLGQGGTVTNSGTASSIISYGANGVGIYNASGTVINQGTITDQSSAGVYFAGGGSVTNSGSASVVQGGLWGVEIGGGPGTVSNDGTITASAAYGIVLNQGGSVTNSGSITSTWVGVVIDNAAGTVENEGTVTARETGIALNDGGYVLNSGSITSAWTNIEIGAATGTVVNEGTLTNAQVGVVLTAGGTVTNQGTSAYISGLRGVAVYGGQGTVVNEGTIIARQPSYFGAGVELTEGGTVTNSGSASSIISTGYYGVQIVGASGAVTNDGTITGRETGVDLTEGGVVTNSGTAALIDGDKQGVNIGGASGTVLNDGTITGGVNLGRGGYVLNSGSITSGWVGVQVSNAAGTVVNEGTVTGGGPAGVVLVAGGTVTNQGTGAYISGGRGVSVYSGQGIVVNEGTIIAQTASEFGTGVLLNDGGTVTNSGTASAIISAGYYGVLINGASGTVMNDGLISNALTDRTAAVSLSAGGYVGNSGSIASNWFGIAISNDTGTVVNEGTITGALTGVLLSAGGAVTNQGTSAYISGERGVQIYGGLGTVVNDGTILAQAASELGSAVYLVDGGAVTNSGTASSIKSDGYFGVEINGASGTVSNDGTIAGQVVGVRLGAGGTVTNSGTISGGTAVYLGGSLANRLVVESGAVFIGGVDASALASNTLEFAAGTGTLGGIGAQFNGFSTLDFDAGAQWLVAGHEAGLNGDTLTGFAKGDTLVVDGFAQTQETDANGVLTLSDGTRTMTLAIAADGLSITDINGNTEITVICYLRGTRILTPVGEVGVETLQIGDPVITRFGGYRAVKWIGRQSFARRFVQTNRAQIPVCISAGALGEGLPKRDLFVSPGHSMLLSGELVLARHLVNGVTIHQDFVPEEIHYYQIEFETHDCVLAEGAWSESYADAPGYRNKFHNAAEFHALYPAYVEPEILNLCAVRPLEGPELAKHLRPLAARAAACSSPGKLRGYIDEITGSGLIRGWAWDEANPELPVLLEIVAGGRVVGTVLACDPRSDLKEAGFALGNCAFHYTSPFGLPIGAAQGVKLRRAQDHAEIRMGQHSLAKSA